MKRFIKDIKAYYKYAIYSAQSELKAEVAGSYLNWIWWLLEPICFVIIYTFIFGYVFNAKEPNFPVFVFIGLTVWDFFSRNLKNSVRMIKNNKAIVSKVYIPKIILIISKMFVNGFKALISFGIVLLMLFIFRIPFTLNIFFIIPLIITLWLITFGFMCFLLHYGVFLEDLSNVINIVLRLLFYLTGIFYSIESKMGGSYPNIALILGKLNPIAYNISSLRKSILYGEMPDIKYMIFWFIISFIISVLGIYKIYRNENSYVKSI